MTHEDETKWPADAGPLERTVRPVAWMSVHTGGQPAQVTIDATEAVRWRCAGGTVVALYTYEAMNEAAEVAANAERHACSIAVWMTRMDSEAEDADDLGVSGWLDEAETRVKRRGQRREDFEPMPMEPWQAGLL